jgi:hypothetical protein
MVPEMAAYDGGSLPFQDFTVKGVYGRVKAVDESNSAVAASESSSASQGQQGSSADHQLDAGKGKQFVHVRPEHDSPFAKAHRPEPPWDGTVHATTEDAG